MGGQRLGEEWWIDLFFWLITTPIYVQAIYAGYRFYGVLRYLYCRFRCKPSWAEMKVDEGDFPMVSVQICCYNEYTVIKRTIDAAASIDWPADKFEVLVCDDSTDETKDLVDQVAAGWQKRGINVRVLRRGTDRTGYKAGILDYAMKYLQGDFILMLDADHIANPKVLRHGMGHFYGKDGLAQDQQIGLVQFPWSYYNMGTSILTEVDALNLDTAFVMEQKCRSQKLGFFGFNGTGGIWRKAAIEAGGGWSWDTVTEDLDLSYKAHINGGCRFVFVEDMPMALEVPPNIAAYKSQKFRWAKGFAQVARKSLFELLSKKDASVELKIECFFHVTSPVQWALALWAFVWWPVLRFLDMAPSWLVFVFLIPLPLYVAATIVGIFGKAPYGKYCTFRQRLGRIRFMFAAMVLCCGMTLNEGYAFLNGLVSKDATFVRTPKEGKLDEDPVNESDAQDDDDGDDEDEARDQDWAPSTDPVIPSVDTAEAAAAPIKKKPKYKAKHSLMWILELLLASYFFASFYYFSTYKNEGRNWNSPNNILSIGYLLPFFGFFFVGISAPYGMLSAALRRCRRHRKRTGKSVAAAAPAVVSDLKVDVAVPQVNLKAEIVDSVATVGLCSSATSSSFTLDIFDANAAV